MPYSVFSNAVSSFQVCTPDERMIVLHSSIDLPYFFSIDGK